MLADPRRPALSAPGRVVKLKAGDTAPHDPLPSWVGVLEERGLL